MPDNAASTGNIEMQSGETNIAGRDISKGDSRDAELLRIANNNSVILAELRTGEAEINKNMREIIDAILDRLARLERSDNWQWFVIALLALGLVAFFILAFWLGG